jgi:hypothetical protein
MGTPQQQHHQEQVKGDALPQKPKQQPRALRIPGAPTIPATPDLIDTDDNLIQTGRAQEAQRHANDNDDESV